MITIPKRPNRLVAERCWDVSCWAIWEYGAWFERRLMTSCDGAPELGADLSVDAMMSKADPAAVPPSTP